MPLRLDIPPVNYDDESFRKILRKIELWAVQQENADRNALSFISGNETTIVVTDSPWNVAGNGTDQITNLIILRNHCRLDPTRLWTWIFPPGDYYYSELDWMRGIMNLRVYAWGAQFKNIKATGQNHALRANTICFNNLPYDQFISGGVPQQFGYRIGTTAANVRTIPMFSAGEESNFTVGMRVLLYGYSLMSNSFPPAPLYWETAVVTGASGGNVAIDRPTMHPYNEDWWDFPVGKGAPRILSLDTPNQTQGKYFEWNGGKILVPTSPFAGAFTPQIQIHGYDQIVLNGMDTEDTVGFVPSCGWNYKISDCHFNGRVENDKVIDYIDYHNCDIGDVAATDIAMFAGVGIGTLKLSARTRIRGEWQSAALTTIIDEEATFRGRSVNNSNVVIRAGDAVNHQRLLDIRSAHVIADDSVLNGAVGALTESTLTVGTVIDATHITCTGSHGIPFVVGHVYTIDVPGITDFTLIGAANSLSGTVFTATGAGAGTGTAIDHNYALIENYYQAIEPGVVAKTADGIKQVTFRDLTAEDAFNVNILVETSAALAPGDVLTWPQLKKLNIGNISGSGPYWPLPLIGSTAGNGLKGVERWNVIGKSNPWQFTNRSFIPPASGGAKPIVQHSPRAPLRRIWCNVTQAYTGTSVGTIFLIIRRLTPTSVDFMTIDLRTLGWREMNMGASFGNVGADVFLAGGLAETGAIPGGTPYYCDSVQIEGPFRVVFPAYVDIADLPTFEYGFEFDDQYIV